MTATAWRAASRSPKPGVPTSTAWPRPSSGPRGLFGHRAHAGVELAVERRVQREHDPQPPRVGGCGRGEARRRRQGAVGIADRGARARVEQRGGVADGARQPVQAREPVEPVAVGRDGHASPRRLEAHEAAAGRRHPDRARRVPAGRRRDDAARHGDRRAAARSARGALGVPRVDGEAEQLGLRRAVVAELRRVRLAGDDQARVEIALHEPGGLLRHPVPERARPHRLGHARERAAQVLEQERDAGQRPVGQPGRDLRLGALDEDERHRVERRARLDALGGGVEQVPCRDLTAPDQLRLRNRVHPPGLLGKAHGGASCHGQNTAGTNVWSAMGGRT